MEQSMPYPYHTSISLRSLYTTGIARVNPGINFNLNSLPCTYIHAAEKFLYQNESNF